MLLSPIQKLSKQVYHHNVLGMYGFINFVLQSLFSSNSTLINKMIYIILRLNTCYFSNPGFCSCQLTLLTLIGAYYSLKFKHYGWLTMIGLIHIVVSPAFSLFIGTFILGFGIIQVYMGFLDSKKRVKATRHD